jgi:hypothetical protein
MKQLFVALITVPVLFACNNEKNSDESSGKMEEKKETAGITYPYTPDYSSDFSIGDVNHSKTVLYLYKMWEEGRVDDFRSVLADSVSLDFPDGNKFKDNTVDRFINFAGQFRKTLSSVKVTFDAWMPVHVNDKKEDYVLVWYREYETDMSGKIDSTRGHAYFQIKNNKIRGWSEFGQKLMAPPPPPAKKK